MIGEMNMDNSYNRRTISIAAIALCACIVLSVLFMLLFSKDSSLFPVVIVAIYLVFLADSNALNYITYPGVTLFLAITTIKYIVLPIGMIITGVWTTNTSIIGNILYVYEEIAVSVVMKILLIRKYKLNRAERSRVSEIDSNGYQFFVVLIVAAVIILIIHPHVLGKFSFSFMDSDEYTLSRVSTGLSGVESVIFNLGKLMLPVVVCIFLNRRNISENVKYYLSFALLIVFNGVFISGTSRNSAIIPAVAGMYTLITLFPQYKKRSLILSFGFIAAVVVSLSLLKAAALGSSSFNSINGFINYLSVYFSGPESTKVSVDTYKIFGTASFSTRLADIFGNLPGLSSRFDLENRTSTFYNIIYYSGASNRSKIIPMVGQGLMHFGYVFSVVPSILCLIAMAHFDTMTKRTVNLTGVFIVSYAAVRCAMSMMSNFSILFSAFYSVIIPLLVLDYLSRKVKFWSRLHIR